MNIQCTFNWIEVTTSLPEFERPVLALLDGMHLCFAYLFTIDGEEKWYYWSRLMTGDCEALMMEHIITHWHHIPVSWCPMNSPREEMNLNTQEKKEQSKEIVIKYRNSIERRSRPDANQPKEEALC